MIYYWSIKVHKNTHKLDCSKRIRNSILKAYSPYIIIHYDVVIMDAIASQITSLTIVYSNVYSDADQSKHQSSASLAFVWGIHRGPVNSPHKLPVTRKMFPFDDVIMYNFIYSNSWVNNCLNKQAWTNSKIKLATGLDRALFCAFHNTTKLTKYVTLVVIMGTIILVFYFWCHLRALDLKMDRRHDGIRIASPTMPASYGWCDTGLTGTHLAYTTSVYYCYWYT